MSHKPSGESAALRLALCVLLTMCAGCDYPRDPEGTYRRVRGGTIRAGVSQAPPWTKFESGEPTGIEVELLREFAGRLDAEIDWQRGSESELIEALEKGRLDIVLGGLKQSSPWSKKVGLTRPFVTTGGDKHVLAVRAGENRWLLELDRFLNEKKAEVLRTVLGQSKRDQAK